MFTGIIEEVGSLEEMRRGSSSVVLSIRAQKVLEGTRIGDSIAVNGICLTVTALHPGRFEACAMHETLNRTSLSGLHRGSRVNLERALALGGRLGGHIVAGHVDGTGRLLKMQRDGPAVLIQIQAAEALLRYIVEKGSVAIDGVSLTVAGVSRGAFTVSRRRGKPGDRRDRKICGAFLAFPAKHGGEHPAAGQLHYLGIFAAARACLERV